MFVAMILVCGLPAGNMGCQALVNAIPMNTSAECYDNIANNIPAIVDSLPYAAAYRYPCSRIAE